MNCIANNLKKYRKLNNYSLQEAGNLLNMSSTAVMKYESGVIVPNSKKLIEFANAYKVKVSDILKQYDSVSLKFNSFRKKKKLTGKRLDILKMLIQDKVSDYLYVLNLNNYEKKKLNRFKCDSLESAENASNEFRKINGLSNNQPMYDLINTLENIGIIIIKLPNKDNMFDGFDGLSEFVDGIPIIVLCDDIDDGARERFTIAHELGHLLLDTKEGLDEEKICNRFASSLLMPKDSMIYEFGNTRNKISIPELLFFKCEYKVSVAATIYRLKEIGIINDYSYRQLCIKISENGWKKDEPYLISKEETHQFEKIVRRLEIDDIISFNKACELLGVISYEYNNEDYN